MTPAEYFILDALSLLPTPPEHFLHKRVGHPLQHPARVAAPVPRRTAAGTGRAATARAARPRKQPLSPHRPRRPPMGTTVRRQLAALPRLLVHHTRRTPPTARIQLRLQAYLGTIPSRPPRAGRQPARTPLPLAGHLLENPARRLPHPPNRARRFQPNLPARLVAQPRPSVEAGKYRELTKNSTALSRLAVLSVLSAARRLVLIFVNPL